jgi:hypothetical protein
VTLTTVVAHIAGLAVPSLILLNGYPWWRAVKPTDASHYHQVRRFALSPESGTLTTWNVHPMVIQSEETYGRL